MEERTEEEEEEEEEEVEEGCRVLFEWRRWVGG